MASHSHSYVTSSGISLLVALGLHAGVFLLSPDLIEASTSRPTVVELEFAPLPVAPPPVEPEALAVPPVRHARRVVAPKAPKPAAMAESETPSALSETSPALVEEPPLPSSPLPAAMPTLPFADSSSAALPLSEADGGGGLTGAGQGARAASGSGTGHTPSASGRGTGAVGARAVQLASKRWECPWPVEAESEDIHEQLVAIRVLVNEQGGVERVDVVSDPGYGFGAAARRCARAARFASALDAQGKSIRAQSPPIHVRFVR